MTRLWRGIGVGLLLAVPLWLLLAVALQAQQTGSYRRVFTIGDTTVTEYGRVDSVRRVFPVSPAPTPTTTTPPTPTPIPPQPIGNGVAFGCSGCLEADPGYPVTLSQEPTTAGNILSKISEGRAKNRKLVLNILGGAHENYVTAGKWDVAKAQARLNTFKAAGIQAAVAKAVADGVILGASVMDEPQQTEASKSWGPAGWLSKVKLDDLCVRAKAVFPTLPIGVVHDYSKFFPDTYYAKCDFIGSQYRLSKGDASAFAKGTATWTAKSHVAAVLMINYLHGGTPSSSCQQYGDESEGTSLCAASPAQIKSWGLQFGRVACAVGGFRWADDLFDKSDIRAALKFVSDSLARLPGKSCRRTA